MIRTSFQNNRYPNLVQSWPTQMKPRKTDLLRAKFLNNFNDFVDFSRNLRVFEEVKRPRIGRRWTMYYFSERIWCKLSKKSKLSMNFCLEKISSEELVWMGGAAGVWAVELFGTTNLGDIIIFVLSKDQSFRIRSAFGDPEQFLILVSHLVRI